MVAIAPQADASPTAVVIETTPVVAEPAAAAPAADAGIATAAAAPAAAGAASTVAALMDAARDAHTAGDAQKSKAVHDAKHAVTVAGAKEVHGGTSAEYIKSIVFGAIDGIITEFALVASVAGANLPIEVVLVTGVAKLLGDGLSMAMGDAMSEAAEHSFIRGEHARETWEYENYPEGEIDEMVEIYKDQHGFTEEDARTILTAMTRKPGYKEYFVRHMMVQELGQLPPDEDASPIKNGVITFVSFMIFGFVPLLAYIIFYGAKYEDGKGQLGICAAVTLLALFALGALQAWIIKQSIVKQGLLMMVNGGVAAASAYLIGWGLRVALDVKEGEC